MKKLSKNNQQNHIQYDHQELYYDNSDKYIAHNCHVWKTMKKHVSNVKSVTRTSKLKLKLRIIRKEIYQKIIQKKSLMKMEA